MLQQLSVCAAGRKGAAGFELLEQPHSIPSPQNFYKYIDFPYDYYSTMAWTKMDFLALHLDTIKELIDW